MHVPELQYRIALTMIPSVGPVTARQLFMTFGSARAIFEENPVRLEKIGRIGPLLLDHITSPSLLRQAGEELEFTMRHRIKVLFFQDSFFPRRLNECKDGPFLLYTTGSQDLNPLRSLSVVGSLPEKVWLTTCGTPSAIRRS